MFSKIKSFLLHLIFDSLLWCGMYQIAIGGVYATYALNLIGFYAAFISIIMFLMCAVRDNEEVKNAVMKNDNKFHNTYSFITTTLEVAVFAALGNFLIASAFTFSMVISLGLKVGWRKENV